MHHPDHTHEDLHRLILIDVCVRGCRNGKIHDGLTTELVTILRINKFVLETQDKHNVMGSVCTVQGVVLKLLLVTQLSTD